MCRLARWTESGQFETMGTKLAVDLLTDLWEDVGDVIAEQVPQSEFEGSNSHPLLVDCVVGGSGLEELLLILMALFDGYAILDFLRRAVSDTIPSMVERRGLVGCNLNRLERFNI